MLYSLIHCYTCIHSVVVDSYISIYALLILLFYFRGVHLLVTVGKQLSLFQRKAFTSHHHPLVLLQGIAQDLYMCMLLLLLIGFTFSCMSNCMICGHMWKPLASVFLCGGIDSLGASQCTI